MASKIAVIVEDDPDTAEMFAEMMRIIGYQVFSSPGGLMAVDLIAEKKPDIVLLDKRKPDVSGVEVLEIIRSDPRLRKTPVIIISGNIMSIKEMQDFEAEPTAYLTKPVAFADLKQEVERLQPVIETDNCDKTVNKRS